MARTPVLERSLSLKVLGAAFIAFLVFVVWLTYAFFNKTFVDSVPVTVEASHTGSQLPLNADVKLRGMIVGEVRDVAPDADGVRLTLAMQPDMMANIPAGVTAQIVPKTLFGEKYVSLLPPADDTGRTLQAGATITRTEVPIEVERLLNDLYPLLEAVDPADLSYTLTAVSSALEGRGTELGETLVTLNDYLQEINPDVPQLITDVEQLGEVADTYADAMPDLGRLLENVVVTGNTVVAKKVQLASFFDEGTRLADSLSTFVEASGDDLAALAGESRPVLETVATYSSVFPCFLGAMDKVIPRLDSVMRDHTVHINIELIAPQDQPTGYASDENAVFSKAALDGSPATAPTCLDLDEINAGGEPHDQANPYPGMPAEVWRLMGIKSTHQKYGTADDFDRAAAGTPASVDGTDTPEQREALKQLLGASVGMDGADVPDIGSLLLSPILRGSAVKVE